LKMLTTAGLGIVVLGIMLAVGASINMNVARNAMPTVQVECEEVTWAANSTWMPLAYPYLKSVEYMYNASTCAEATLIKAGNYTWNERQVYLSTTNQASFGDGVKYLNYTAYSGAGAESLYNSTTSLSTLSSWIPIIAVVLAAAVVIGILVAAFKFGAP